MSLAAWAYQVRQAAQLGSGATTRDGTVTSYDPKHFAVKVMLQPDEVETGWMPIKTAQIGNGWGIYAAPQVGDLCTVEFQEDDELVPRVSGFVPNDQDQPPEVPAGEIWLVHKSLSVLKFTEDGDVIVTSNRDLMASVGRNLSAAVSGDANISVTGDITSSAPSWSHTGDLDVDGDIHSTGTIAADADVLADGISGKAHLHNGVTSGSSNTGAPV